MVLPNVKSFSETNLKYMKYFYQLYNQISPQLVDENASEEISPQLVDAFVGREYQLLIGETEKFIDLLFYNIRLHCYVVVEVKTGKFDSAHIGQLGTYVAATNHILKSEQDNPTIGLLICKEKDNVLAQYALESGSEPIGISEYELSKLYPEDFKGTLPSIEEIEQEFSNSRLSE